MTVGSAGRSSSARARSGRGPIRQLVESAEVDRGAASSTPTGSARPPWWRARAPRPVGGERRTSAADAVRAGRPVRHARGAGARTTWARAGRSCRPATRSTTSAPCSTSTPRPRPAACRRRRRRRPSRPGYSCLLARHAAATLRLGRRDPRRPQRHRRARLRPPAPRAPSPARPSTGATAAGSAARPGPGASCAGSPTRSAPRTATGPSCPTRCCSCPPSPASSGSPPAWPPPGATASRPTCRCCASRTPRGWSAPSGSRCAAGAAGRSEVLVLGALDRPAVAAGATAALAARWAAAGRLPAGAGGLGAIAEPVPFLTELAERRHQGGRVRGRRLTARDLTARSSFVAWSRSRTLTLDEIDLSDPLFWARPRRRARGRLPHPAGGGPDPVLRGADRAPRRSRPGRGYYAPHPPRRRARGVEAAGAVLLRARARTSPTCPPSSSSSSAR